MASLPRETVCYVCSSRSLLGKYGNVAERKRWVPHSGSRVFRQDEKPQTHTSGKELSEALPSTLRPTSRSFAAAIREPAEKAGVKPCISGSRVPGKKSRRSQIHITLTGIVCGIIDPRSQIHITLTGIVCGIIVSPTAKNIWAQTAFCWHYRLPDHPGYKPGILWACGKPRIAKKTTRKAVVAPAIREHGGKKAGGSNLLHSGSRVPGIDEKPQSDKFSPLRRTALPGLRKKCRAMHRLFFFLPGVSTGRLVCPRKLQGEGGGLCWHYASFAWTDAGKNIESAALSA